MHLGWDAICQIAVLSFSLKVNPGRGWSPGPGQCSQPWSQGRTRRPARRPKERMDAFLEEASPRPLPSRWKLRRQELLKYLEYFLLAVIYGCQMAAPPNRTEAMWEDFITCLKDQDPVSSAVLEAQSCYLLTKAALFRSLFLTLDDNFYYQSMRYEV